MVPWFNGGREEVGTGVSVVLGLPGPCCELAGPAQMLGVVPKASKSACVDWGSYGESFI